MPTFILVPHPSTPCDFVHSAIVQAEPVAGAGLQLTYALTGDLQQLIVPDPRQPARVDGLWRATCFEIFLRAAGSAPYEEFNFAPSCEWAAYAFEGYRQGMKALEQPQAPRIICRREAQRLEVEVQFHSTLLAEHDLRAALSAVLKHKDGKVSYWALAHPRGKPDFHDAVGFVGEGLKLEA